MSQVLFLHSSSDLYGSDRSLIRTVDSVLDLGVKVIVCLPYHGPLVSFLEEKGCQVHVFGLGVLRRKYFNFLGIMKFTFSFLLSVFRIWKIVRDKNVKVIHSNSTGFFSGGVVAWLVGVPHIWHVREILVKPIFLRKLIHRIVAKLSTRIVAVSEATRDHVLLDEPSSYKKIQVINNGIDIEKYQGGDGRRIRQKLGLGESDLLVGMIGRVSHWKGQDLFVSLAKKILPKYNNVFFLALGSPFMGMENLMEEFKKSASILDSDRFVIHEFSENVNDYLASFDVFLLPSTQPDPFPTTVLEAMSTSKAIIVNGHGGAIEMIDDHESGLIVNPPNSIDIFEECLETLVNNKELREDFGRQAKFKVQNNYTVNIYHKNIQKLYRGILS